MPLTTAELESYFERFSVSPAGRAYIARVREGLPARRVGGGHANVVCRYASKKMGFTIQAESEGPEFSYVISLEFDDDIVEYYDQPETLQLQAKNKHGHRCSPSYTPDYLALSLSKGPILIECKKGETAEELVSVSPNWWMDSDGTVHYEPLRLWAKENGIGSRVALSSEIPGIRVQNLLMLADYFDPRTPAIDDVDRRRVLTAFKSPPWATRRQLLDADGEITADHLNWMVAHQELCVAFDSQALADDIRTLIFKDQAAMQAYQALQRCSGDVDPFEVRAVSLEPGSAVVWDGILYTVAQYGETCVFLMDQNKKVRTVQRRDIDQLIADGYIQADSLAPSTTSLAAKELLMTTSPKDMDFALIQLKKLEGNFVGPKIPTRTMEWLRARFRRGEKLYGNGFLGLIPGISKRGNRGSKLAASVLKLIKETLDEFVFVPDGSVSAGFGEFLLLCKERHIAPTSERTYRLYAKRIQRQALERIKRGHKAAHQFEPWHMRLEYKTPRHGQRPFEIGHIDHTELDIHLVDEAYGTRTMRPWLTVLIDAYSRKILASYLTYEKPSYLSAMCVIRNCLRHYGRGCDFYVVDQGAEFNSRNFESLIARLGAHKKERPASKPRFGSIVERFFGSTTTQLLQHMKGSNQLLKNPRSISPSHDPRKRAIWTLREFEPAWQGWLDTYYHVAQHGTLGTSPDIVFHEGLRRFGYRAHCRFAFDDAMKMLCLPAVSTPDGCLAVNAAQGYVKTHGVHYHGDVLRKSSLVCKRAPVRHDPFDISRVWAFIGGKWNELRCNFACDLEGLSLSELRIYTEELIARHGKQHVQRQNSLALLASHRRTIRKTESLLTQQKHSADMETVISDKPGSDQPSSVPPKQSAKPKFNVEAHWNISEEEHEGESHEA